MAKKNQPRVEHVTIVPTAEFRELLKQLLKLRADVLIIKQRLTKAEVAKVKVNWITAKSIVGHPNSHDTDILLWVGHLAFGIYHSGNRFFSVDGLTVEPSHFQPRPERP